MWHPALAGYQRGFGAAGVGHATVVALFAPSVTVSSAWPGPTRNVRTSLRVEVGCDSAIIHDVAALVVRHPAGVRIRVEVASQVRVDHVVKPLREQRV
jgi:hypothetical protein